MSDRRDFLIGAAAAGAALVSPMTSFGASRTGRLTRKGKLVFRFRPYTLEMKHVFTVAEMSRSTTPAMMTEIEFDGLIGYGEASMPPYLGESHKTAQEFLSKVDLSTYDDPFQMERILGDVDAISPGNPAAKASVDIALHDLVGKLLGQPWFRIWGLDAAKAPLTTFTIGIDTAAVVREKMKEVGGFKMLKVKLGKDNDREMIETVRSMSKVPLTADPNQGWQDRQYAIDMAHWLKEQGVLYIEQPMPKERIDDLAWLTANSPLPILGDEGIQRLPDLIKAKEHGTYGGVVIKLMKTTGMREAHTMARLARSFGMKTLIGCMTETSCAVSAASHLTPLIDWADLDGNLLIKNDIFEGMKVVDGRIVLSDQPGIGIKKIA
ncbi:MAG: dipeptide epimerase [Ignavibacteria bacterium GWA2_55_11]|nr:MAG: dipeptide epimerase [Ignavibacteria bacterium GWA2_55_11]OGU47051.1 MAG: dipeptide epimerase [Ignavibacteria bacterium GWC2_56_12]OGU67102.1 MAG: dipeptide epimerase [Ignavibacteria bacterium RIFCSPHIGHO2_02_FULL_56_12]OGU72571.1 MAG: dipeptide epimerase [Ignavibacteria bacterium RIFCSPLOWO2_02_FULL_55_14]OGU74727.1 MAG: dipeptide epimerase [Ignavibacteria bacterium RIFCSPLOWO2_12_FULL_56_21]HAV22641.1 dipeptide epimerase [Bacteroidota bacterium]